jgi:AraC-like DNA-binding protein
MAVVAQDALGTPIGGEGGATRRPRTTFLQRNLVLALKHAQPDLSLRAIAGAVGISESSVSRILAYQTADLKASTKGVMATAILERLDDWARASRIAAKKGYHQPAKDFIEAAGGIEPKAPVSANVNVTPTVVLNMPFQLGAIQATPEPPALDATTVNLLTPPPE